MPGPLPNQQRRRRNAPAIPTTRLPAAGFAGPIPKCPYDLGRAGKAWWRWAWRTPSAAAWGPGDTYAIARRAQLEDDSEALTLPAVDLADYLDVDDSEALRCLADALRRLKALAGNRVTLMKEMRELDKRFGLDPKAIAELRWSLEAPAPEPTEGGGTVVRPDRWASMTVADSA